MDKHCNKVGDNCIVNWTGSYTFRRIKCRIWNCNCLEFITTYIKFEFSITKDNNTALLCRIKTWDETVNDNGFRWSYPCCIIVSFFFHLVLWGAIRIFIIALYKVSLKSDSKQITKVKKCYMGFYKIK